MKKYIVHTHNGDEFTVAKSPEKAINNVRFRMFGRSYNGVRYSQYWEAEEVK